MDSAEAEGLASVITTFHQNGSWVVVDMLFLLLLVVAMVIVTLGQMFVLGIYILKNGRGVGKLIMAADKERSYSQSMKMSFYDTILDAPIPEDICLCRLHGAVSVFTSWLSEITL
eukprot:Gb_10695 [translate_table: standard]